MVLPAAKLQVTVALMWVPVVPAVASDVWRLLTPLMNARAVRLRAPFALASGLVALGAVLLMRHYAGAAISVLIATPLYGPL